MRKSCVLVSVGPVVSDCGLCSGITAVRKWNKVIEQLWGMQADVEALSTRTYLNLPVLVEEGGEWDER